MEEYHPTIENTFSKDYKFRGSDYTISVIDTAGQVAGFMLDSVAPIDADVYARVS